LMDPREIQSLEELCIQDDAPWCQAACPLHVDVRAMLAAVARGDFAAGAAIYRKKVPFPGILARICDQPCRPVCKREEAGGAIEIGLLERSCAEQAGFGADAPRRAGLARSERIAIVGAGLSGMTAALELARRGYAVKVIEATGQAGGALRRLPAEQLPSEVIDEEVERLGRYGVEVVFKTLVGTDVKLDDLLQQFEAVFVATGRAGIADGTQGRDEELARVLASDIDPVTLSAFREGVFAGGSLRGLLEGGTEKRAEGDRRVGDQSGGYSPVCSITDGLRAAVSIERFLKGESLAAYRDREGPYETRLFTSLEGVEATPPVVVAGSGIGYSADEAAAEAARCLQCQCLECVKACEYLEHFREYPGACIRKVTKNITSLPGKSYRTHTKFINACSLCGLCGAVCPTGLDMAVVNGEARKIMWGREFMPPAIHEFALRDMEASDDQSSLVVRNQPGHESSEYVFFPGCQLTASEPDNVERVYRHLAARLPGGVGLMLGCCGAPAAWSGRQALYEERGGVLTEQWEALGRPRVILACPTCSLMFASGLPDVPAVSLWEVLDEVGLPVRKEDSADRATIMAGGPAAGESWPSTIPVRPARREPSRTASGASPASSATRWRSCATTAG